MRLERQQEKIERRVDAAQILRDFDRRRKRSKIALNVKPVLLDSSGVLAAGDDDHRCAGFRQRAGDESRRSRRRR